MDDLLKAFQMFQGSVQQAAVSNAVEGASQYMNQINAQISDEAQKRQALQNLGNNLALRLTGVGANAAQVEQAFRAVSPQNFGSAEQLQLEGQLSGNKQYQQVAGDIIKQREQKQKSLIMMQHANDLEKMRRANEFEMAREMIKAGAKPQDLKPEDVAFKTNVEMAYKFIDQLSAAVERSGTWESRLGNTEDAAVLESVPYQLAITYSKLVDPNSVARESEVESAKQFLMGIGATKNDAQTLAQLEHLKKSIKGYEAARGGAKSPTASKAVSVTPSNNIQVRRLQDGTLVRVKQNAQGQWESVD